MSLPAFQLDCGTSGNAVPTMLLKCGTQANAVPTLLRACTVASTNPCDYDTILATLSGLTFCSCAELSSEYFLANLSLASLPVIASRTYGCCFSANLGTVDLYSADPYGSPPCSPVTYVTTVAVVLYAYCFSGGTANTVWAPGLAGYGISYPILWSDGGVNGWTDWPNANFGTFTRYGPECWWYTKGGVLTLEAP